MGALFVQFDLFGADVFLKQPVRKKGEALLNQPVEALPGIVFSDLEFSHRPVLRTNGSFEAIISEICRLCNGRCTLAEHLRKFIDKQATCKYNIKRIAKRKVSAEQ